MSKASECYEKAQRKVQVMLVNMPDMLQAEIVVADALEQWGVKDGHKFWSYDEEKETLVFQGWSYCNPVDFWKLMGGDKEYCKYLVNPQTARRTIPVYENGVVTGELELTADVPESVQTLLRGAGVIKSVSSAPVIRDTVICPLKPDDNPDLTLLQEPQPMTATETLLHQTEPGEITLVAGGINLADVTPSEDEQLRINSPRVMRPQLRVG